MVKRNRVVVDNPGVKGRSADLLDEGGAAMRAEAAEIVAQEGAGAGFFGRLPFFYFDPAWIECSAAACCGDERVVAALVRLLIACWRADPAGEVPTEPLWLARVCGVDEAFIARWRAVLLAEFEIFSEKRVARHIQLAHVAGEMRRRFGGEIASFVASSALAVQSPGEFSVVAVESARGRVKGLTMIPRGFGLHVDPALTECLILNGVISPVDQVKLMERFVAESRASRARHGDWVEAFKAYVLGGARRGGRSANGVRDAASPSVFDAVRSAAGETPGFVVDLDGGRNA